MFRNIISILLLCLLISSCEGGGSSGGSKPESIAVSVELPNDFTVSAGEEYTIDAFGEFSPFHPDVELTYRWTKSIYFQPLEQLIEDNGGVFDESLLQSIETDTDFSRSPSVTDVSMSLGEGGYIQYSVQIGAAGYTFDLSELDSGNHLFPFTSRYTDFIRVYVVD